MRTLAEIRELRETIETMACYVAALAVPVAIVALFVWSLSR